MAHVITRLCEDVCDTACVDVCPVDCIVGPVSVADIRQRRADALEKGEPVAFESVQLFIDPDRCIDCGACAPECPADAIFLDDDVPDELVDDIARNEAFFRNA